MLKFIIALTLTALIFWGALEVAITYDWLHLKPTFSFEILVLLFSATLIIFYYLLRVPKETFVQLYLLTMAVKILAYASFALIMIVKDRAGATSNVLFFLAVYFVFTALEIGFLYHRFNTSGDEHKPS